MPDRDLVLALSQKKATVLADRLKRVRNILGTNGKKPRYNAVLTLTTDNIGEAQRLVEDVLDEWTRRWKLDEVVDNDAKPSVIYSLVRLRRSVDRKQFITALHSEAGNTIQNVNLEVGDELAAEEEARAKELEKAESA